jgi:hypothetical protein
MSSIPTSSPFQPQNNIPHQNGKGVKEEKEPPTEWELIVERIQPARDILSKAFHEEHAEYEDVNRVPLTNKCKKILEDNIEKAKTLNDVESIAHLIFNHYRDSTVEKTLDVFYRDHPSEVELDKVIRDSLKGRAHMLHHITIEEPILDAIKEKFPDLDYSKVKFDLGQTRDV